MHSAYFWNKHNLLGRKVVFTLILFILAALSTAEAQNKKPKNLPNYDDKTLHFGFYVAPQFSIFRVKYSSFFQRNLDTVFAVRPKGSPGFSTGFLISLRLNDYWNFRFLPGVSFYERGIFYRFKDAPEDRQVIESTFIELPFMVKFKSERRQNVRMYMTGGIKAGFEVGAKRKERTDRQLRTNNRDLSIEYGIGLELFYPLFKFAPEIRFSLGVNNMLEPDNNIYANTISRMYTNSVTLFLNFE